MKNYTRKVILSVFFLILALIFQNIASVSPDFVNNLCLSHIAVILCGFLCGPISGMILGFIVPPLSSLLFSTPAIFPAGVMTAFELASYGFFSGFIYRLLRKSALNIYVTLISSMLSGRIAFGISMFLVGIVSTNKFTFSTFVSYAFVSCFLGIILHLAIIPPIVFACEKSNIISNK